MVRLAILASILLSILSGLLLVQPAEAHTGRYYVTARPGLNLRTGPGGNYRILDQMPTNRIVKARGHSGNWMKLTDLTTGITGWASLSYLKVYTAPTTSPSSGGAICLTNYWNEYVCSSDDTGNAIRYWAGQYGIGWYWLAATAACESSFHLYVVNSTSGVSGLFQFEPSTFYAWGGSDLWDAWDQSKIAAKMFANGAANQYECARLIGYV
jgi:uncharacterized protein YgiM (DUF1202 family)